MRIHFASINRTFVAITAAAFCAIMPAANGSVTVYQDTDTSANFVPDTNDGTPNRPTGNLMGNTITLSAGPSLLSSFTVQIGTNNPNIANQDVTLSLYLNDGSADTGGSGLLQPGTLIGSQTVTNVSLLGGFAPVAFNFPSLLVPGTFTFVIGLTPGSPGAGSFAGVKTTASAPQVGTGLNTLWFGTGTPGAWTSNGTWALADGASTNHIDAVVVADPVPEQTVGCYLALGCGLVLLNFRRKHRAV